MPHPYGDQALASGISNILFAATIEGKPSIQANGDFHQTNPSLALFLIHILKPLKRPKIMQYGDLLRGAGIYAGKRDIPNPLPTIVLEIQLVELQATAHHSGGYLETTL
jgi:hypothetical protein